jgi:hypothetical protein
MEVEDAVCWMLNGVARGNILVFDYERKKLLVTEKLADHHDKCVWTRNRYMTGHVILDGKLF